jgi:microcystin-dependent protein
MDPYLGEIKMFTGSYTPRGWLPCDGRTVRISDNEALYSLIGTAYGGDGSSTFGLPDLRGRVPVHIGGNYNLGKQGGAEVVFLNADTNAAHTHAVACSDATATAVTPQGNCLAANADNTPYAAASDLGMNGDAVTKAGGSQPHANMPPYLAVNFIIATEGVYPQQS